MTYEYFIDTKVPSCANLREHWAKKAKRVKHQRKMAYWETLKAVSGRTLRGHIWIKMIRQSPRPLDFDNLAFSLKGIRDGIADGLGLNDDRERVGLVWEVAQIKGKPQGVKVEIKNGDEE